MSIADLRPTQITIGFREVEDKRRRWRELSGPKRVRYLERHPVPVLAGPKHRLFLIDHHHLARALLDEGCRAVDVSVVADLSQFGKQAFWAFADRYGWCHPYDAAGRRVAFDEIPKRVGDLSDDPYRSLAGALRRAGGFSKAARPFSEFMWADALRRKVDAGTIETDFPVALAEALAFAQSDEARSLPGWCGLAALAA